MEKPKQMEDQSPNRANNSADNPTVAGGVDATSKAKTGKRNLVAGVLGPALKLWLRSQVEAVERLEVAIGSETGAGDSLSSRQMLAGRIPLVQVEADGVIYKGLHLGQLQLTGRDIRMNLGQAVRGKPLKLLAPIVVDLSLKMTEAQLNESLESPLLAPQLGEWLNLLQELLVDDPADKAPLSQPKIALAGGTLGADLGAERLGLRLCQGLQSAAAHIESAAGHAEPEPAHVEAIAGQPQAEALPGPPNEMAIETGLTVRNGNLLKLRQPCWSSAPPAGFQADLSSLAMMPLKLGSDVAIEQIAIAAGQLHLSGQLTVHP